MIQDLINAVGWARALIGTGVVCVTLAAFAGGGFVAGLTTFGVITIFWGIVEGM